MCSPEADADGEVPAELAALPHAIARQMTAANKPIDWIDLTRVMLAALCDGTVTA